MKQEQVQVQTSKSSTKRKAASKRRPPETDQRSPSGKTTYAN